MQIVSDFFKNWINPYFSSAEEPLPAAQEHVPLQPELDTEQQTPSENEQIPNPILEEIERETQLEGATEGVPARREYWIDYRCSRSPQKYSSCIFKRRMDTKGYY